MFRVIPLQQSKRCLIRFTLAPNKSIQVALDHHATPAVSGHHAVSHKYDRNHVYPRAGNREWVGFGKNGEPQYFDHCDTPCPSLRWKNSTPEIEKLREKARGDWKTLTVDEKKSRK
jgi:hypothetical protein